MNKFLVVIILFLNVTATAQYPHNGYAPEVKRIHGTGNGNNWLELTGATESNALSNYSDTEPVYQSHFSPFKISVFDTSMIIPGTYQVEFDSTDLNSDWKIYRVGTQDTVYSSQSISSGADQFITQWGLVLTINQFLLPIEGPDTSGFEKQYNSINQDWLTFIPDINSHPYQNLVSDFPTTNKYSSYGVNGFGPYGYIGHDTTITNSSTMPVAYSFSFTVPMGQPEDLFSFDLVFTADTNFWTRCPVIEMCADLTLSSDGTDKQKIRNAPSVNRNGLPDGTGTGMGWFPGYAINIETAERLNMVFGENTALQNGNDMKFNPGDLLYDTLGNPVFGGMHYIYLFDNVNRYSPGQARMPNYDGGTYMDVEMHGTVAELTKVWRSCRWVGFPLTNTGHTFLETETRVKVRVSKPHVPFQGDTTIAGFLNPLYEFDIQPSTLLNTNENATNNPGLNVFPNPSSDQALFIIDDIKEEISELIFTDINGKLILNEANKRANSYLFIRNNLENGVYFYQIRTKSGKFFTGKLVLI